jgi:hypothetical protein
MRDACDVLIDLRDGGDWSLDLCFAGLRMNGVDVIDVPYRTKHREWWDVLEGRVRPDWGLERRTLGFTGHDDRGYRFPGASLVEAEGMIRERRVRRVWLDERMESFAAYRSYGFMEAGVPVVVVAGHDRFWNHSPEFVASLYGDRLEGMLLDNWYPSYDGLPFKARRIGWSCNFDHYWRRPVVPPEKDIDVSFIGYNSHPDRERYVSFLQGKFPGLRMHLVLETQPDSFAKFVPKSEYFNVIQRSRIALNLRGAADRGKTMRAYEIPYVGSFMLSQGIDDPGMGEDFWNLVHCAYFHSETQLARQIEWFLGISQSDSALVGESHREEIARRGHLRTLSDLSVKARWGDVLKWLDGNPG